ncbi:hypothetical protein ACN47E_002261 [Coniothyrium glycines]
MSLQVIMTYMHYTTVSSPGAPGETLLSKMLPAVGLGSKTEWLTMQTWARRHSFKQFTVMLISCPSPRVTRARFQK